MLVPDDGRVAWRQLADHLRARIRSGDLAPGDALPSELRLVRETGRSRTTIRQAIAQLRLEGLVATRQPQGTFVLGADGPVMLSPGDSATSCSAIAVTHADGRTEIYPAGTIVRRPVRR